MLVGGHIRGLLSFHGATLNNGDGRALSSAGLVVDKAVFLREGFTAEGEVHLAAARIGGRLFLDNATFINPGRQALNLNRLTVNQDRDQPFLLPPDLHDWLPADHLAWFVRDVVDQLDLQPFLRAYRTDGHGHSAYDPKTLLGVLLYAYATGVRSSRQIERRCTEDLAFRVLAANQLPTSDCRAS